MTPCSLSSVSSPGQFLALQGTKHSTGTARMSLDVILLRSKSAKHAVQMK
jgi:hypothetical protein